MSHHSQSGAIWARRLRRCFFVLHLWVGLLGGLLISVTGLTGSATVFEPEISQWLHPHLLRVEPQRKPVLSLPAVAEAVKRRDPDARISYVGFPKAPDDVFMVGLKGEDGTICVHPHTGVMLGVYDYEKSWMATLVSLHVELLSGENGEKIVGIGGVMLLILCVTGIYLWWPKKWLQGFVVKWRANWKRLNWDLHRVGGILCAALLIIIALSGIAFPFGAFVGGVVSAATRSTAQQERPKSVVREGLPAPTLTLIEQRIRAAIPDARIISVSFPQKPRDVWLARMRHAGDNYFNGTSNLYLDRYTGQVLRVDDPRRMETGARWMLLRYAYHFGHWGGTLTRILYVLAGLAPALLYITGLLMWWNRIVVPRRRKRIREAKQKIVRAAAP